MNKNMKKRTFKQGAAVAAVMGAALVTGCGGDGDVGDVFAPGLNTLPAGVTDLGANAFRATTVGSGMTAATQDLLTGGLGKSGLISGAAVPAYADPANPTADELRRTRRRLTSRSR